MAWASGDSRAVVQRAASCPFQGDRARVLSRNLDLELAVAWLGTDPIPDARDPVWVATTAPLGCPWTYLGCALDGVDGKPLLSGTGTLDPGSAGSIDLFDAAPTAPVLFAVSLPVGTVTPVPFKGGMLKVIPMALGLTLATNGAGELHLPFGAWPPGVPPGTTFVFQVLIQDVVAVKGVALSNALRADTP